MKYKIEIWQYHSITETHKSNKIYEILEWYRDNWKQCYDYGNCTFYLYENGKKLSFDEEYKLGFYYDYD